MSTNRSRRIDRDAAEHLLGRCVDGTQGGQDPLADLLAAAASPGTARELAGEETALTAFREAARLAPVPQPRRRSMAACAPARFLSAKVAAAALAATALGGVAVAASTGNLPAALGGSPAEAPASLAPTSSAPGTGAPTSIGSAPGRAGAPAAGAATAPAAMVALCRSWAGAGKATADSRFEPLTRAAGGPDRVGAYCDELSHRPGTSASADGTQPSGSGSADPSGGASAHPGNGPDPSASHGKVDPGNHSDKPTPTRTDAPADHSHQPTSTATDHAKQ